MGILTKHLYEKPIPPHELPPPVDVPPALEAVIMKCLEKKAEIRYQNMAELLADMEALEAGLTPQAVVDRVERNTHTGQKNTPSDLMSGGRVTMGVGQPEVPKKNMAIPIVIGVLVLAGIGIGVAMGGGDDKTGTEAHVVQPAPTTPDPAPVAPAPDPAPAPPTAANPPAPEPVAAPTLVLISSDPDGAEVYREGSFVGNTPYKLTKPAGSDQVQLELRRSGYDSKPFLINALTGEELKVTLSRKKSGSRPQPAQPTQTKPDKPRPSRPTAQSEVLDPWD
jgi:serine/threonine-protein kinase